MLYPRFGCYATQLGAVIGCLLTAACGATTGSETSAEQQEGLGEAACATIAADITASPLEFTSPTTYTHSSCFKAYIADAGASNLTYDFAWNAATPTNSADCTSAVIYAQQYTLVSGAYVAVGTKVQSNGVWSGGTCHISNIVFSPTGAGERFAVSARSGGASGPTVSFAGFPES
jgi:hypothetical protein